MTSCITSENIAGARMRFCESLDTSLLATSMQFTTEVNSLTEVPVNMHIFLGQEYVSLSFKIRRWFLTI